MRSPDPGSARHEKAPPERGLVSAETASGSGRRVVPQLPPQDLADIGLGQFLSELDHLGLLVAGEVLAGMGLDLLSGEGWILLDHDQLHHLAGLLVGYA